jgi:hypothetical protein
VSQAGLLMRRPCGTAFALDERVEPAGVGREVDLSFAEREAAVAQRLVEQAEHAVLQALVEVIITLRQKIRSVSENTASVDSCGRRR